MSSFTGRLVGFEPVVAKAGVGNEGNSHLESILHLFEDNAFYLFFLFWEDGEVEFVVYLENHLAPDALGLKTIKDMNHSHLNDVGSSALNGGIDGITVFGLAERLDIPRDEAKMLIDGYFQTFPQVQDYMEQSKEVARQQGYVTTLFGRRRYLPDINSANATVRGFAERNAINAPFQGTAADII